MPPTKVLITSTCIHRIASYLVHDHSTKLPVRRSYSPTFVFSPKCVPYDPIGVAGTLIIGDRDRGGGERGREREGGREKEGERGGE